MTQDELAYSTIYEIGPRIRSGEVTSRQVTEACLARIERFNPQVNAFITLLGDQALEQARQADEEIASGRYRGPLHGVPLAHKDLYYTSGVRTTAGSKILADFVPDEDAAAVARLKEAGTVMIGKASLHEFARGGSNDNPHYGPVHNPWALDCVPGGSSGGSAAALAAGFCLAATGTDTAASIRHPAAMCGVTGIKPTYGRVSCYGVVPLNWSLDHAGPLARSVQDCAMLLQAMAGYDWRDPASVDMPVPDFSARLNEGVRGVRVGVPRNYFVEHVQPDVWSAYQEALSVLGDLGARLVEVEFDQLAKADRRMSVEAAVYHEQWLRERPQDYGEVLRAGLESGLADARDKLSALDYAKGLRNRAALLIEMRKIFLDIDVLATPTVPLTTTPIGQERYQLDGQDLNIAEQWVRCTWPFNASGFPASSEPCGFDREGKPIGLQIAGRPWEEATVLQVAAAYQQATDWQMRRPPLAGPSGS